MKKPTPQTFQQYAAAHIDRLRSGATLTHAGRKASPNTAAALQTAARRVNSYDPDATARSMSLAWFGGLMQHLLSADLAHNTISTTIKQVKILLRSQCEAERVSQKEQYATPKPEHVGKVYNTASELAQLAATKLPERTTVARDAYLIQCATGLRFGDLKRILATAKQYVSEVEGRRFLRFTQQKTHQTATDQARGEDARR